REVDDFGQMWRAHEHQQMQHRRVLHEAGDDTAMDGRQRVADVVLVLRQAEHHLVAETQALDADQPGVRHQPDQRIVVVAGMRLLHQGAEVEAVHTAPSLPSPPWAALPMRMKVPTTWAM